MSKFFDSKAKVLQKLFVIDLEYDGCKYTITTSSNLKEILEVEEVSGNHKHDISELAEVIWFHFIYLNSDVN
jgi:hypothetical protein